MKCLFRMMLTGTVLLFCSGLCFSDILPKDSSHGQMWLIQTAPQATLNLNDRKSQLKLADCKTTATPNILWHFRNIPLEKYIRFYAPHDGSYGNITVLAILSGTVRDKNEDSTVSIPLEINKPVQDGSGIIYKKVKTDMANIPNPLTLSNVTLLISPQNVTHARLN